VNKKRDASPQLTLELPPPADLNQEVWLASTLSLHRNVDKYLFPGCLEPHRRAQLLQLMETALRQLPQLRQPRFMPAEELPPTDKELLGEHYLVNATLQQAHAGEGFLIDQPGNFLAICNVQDHLVLHQLEWKGELEDQWNRLATMEAELTKTLPFAFSPRFGFLTANPTQCGTGLIVQCFLHLPALIHTSRLQELLKPQEELVFSSLLGEGEGYVGDLLVLRNTATLGTTEESIITTLRQATSRLISAETAARTALISQPDLTLRNKIGRAFGLLAHSVQLDAAEALDQMSLLKLGVHLQWVTGLTPAQCNALFFLLRRGHLSAHHHRPLDPDEAPLRRADLIRDLLRPAQFIT
jgi:protein arginine kinase